MRGAWIAFDHPCRDHAAAVSTHISGFGKETTAHTAKHSNRAATKTESSNTVTKSVPVSTVGVEDLVNGQQGSEHEHANRAKGIAHHAATTECSVEARHGTACTSDEKEDDHTEDDADDLVNQILHLKERDSSIHDPVIDYWHQLLWTSDTKHAIF